MSLHNHPGEHPLFIAGETEGWESLHSFHSKAAQWGTRSGEIQTHALFRSAETRMPSCSFPSRGGLRQVRSPPLPPSAP